MTNVAMIIYILNFFISINLCDAAEPWQLNLQDPATPIAEGMLHFHNYLMTFLITIGFFIVWMLFKCIYSFNSQTNIISQKFTHCSVLEFIWTIIPAIILLLIAIPSFVLLYSIDDFIDPDMTVKIIGHQWYWSYEFNDFEYNFICGRSLSYDSYMISTDDLTEGSFRLLEVDNRLLLPKKAHIRLLVTSADVLHSWAVPSFGIKVDACPGRLSQATLFLKRSGVYYGQCSEICGVNHGFMPIVVKVRRWSNFLDWFVIKLGYSTAEWLALHGPFDEFGAETVYFDLLALKGGQPKGRFQF